MASTTPPQSDAPPVDRRPGASWKDKEEQVLPKNRLGIVFFGLMCTMFLAALDQTIVATALPTIVAKLGGGSSYSWVGSSYMLAAGAFGPLYGKLSNMIGRKPILHASILIFLLGSALCGAAQSMTWLVVSRAIQGIGGGGIMQLVVIVLSDIVPLKDRGSYGGALGAAYGIAGVIGPLLGGVLAEHVSWRWCFFINLPTGGVAALVLFVFLNLTPHQKRPIRDQLAELDVVGLVCLVAGVVCLLIGFDFGETAWSAPRTIALLVVGSVLLVVGAVNEIFTKSSAIIPPRLFKTRTTGIILITGFLHALICFQTSYYLPLFYQVLGASATSAGIKMLTYSLATSSMSIISGVAMTKMGEYRSIIWVGFAVMTLGLGLMVMLDYTSSLVTQEIFPMIAGLGIGCLFQPPLVGLQAAMPMKDMATASSAFIFLRTVGAAVGIAIGEAIIASVLPQKLARIPNFANLGIGTTVTQLNNSVGIVHLIPDVALRNAVLHAWSQAIETIWIVCTPMSGFALVLTLFMRAYSLDSKTVRSDEVAAATRPGDLENGLVGVVALSVEDAKGDANAVAQTEDVDEKVEA